MFIANPNLSANLGKNLSVNFNAYRSAACTIFACESDQPPVVAEHLLGDNYLGRQQVATV